MACPVGFYGPACQYPITARNMDALLQHGRITQEQYDAYLETLKPSEQWERRNIPTPTDDMFSMNTLIMGLLLLKLAKVPGGLKVIQTLGKEFLKGIFDTLHALGQASAANQVAAWANPFIVALVLRRFGFIDNLGASEFKAGISVITGASVAEGFLDTLQGIFPFSSPEPSEFPSSIVYSARTEGDVTTEEVELKK